MEIVNAGTTINPSNSGTLSNQNCNTGGLALFATSRSMHVVKMMPPPKSIPPTMWLRKNHRSGTDFMKRGHGPEKLFMRMKALMDIAQRPRTMSSTFLDSSTQSPSLDSSTSSTMATGSSTFVFEKKFACVMEGGSVRLVLSHGDSGCGRNDDFPRQAASLEWVAERDEDGANEWTPLSLARTMAANAAAMDLLLRNMVPMM
mmetsp:Transcript_20127/g.36382  ORF Transcript_20127/g.36382 Transcript_20127/m.36382 type:complete len:202 (-) Transcript_20127:49-654(-)